MTIKPLAIALAASAILVACGEKAEEAAPEVVEAPAVPTLESIDERISYIVGNNVAQQFERDGLTMNQEAFALAFEDIKNGAEPRLSQEEMQATIMELQQAQQEKRQQEMLAIGDTNKAEGEAFLAENATKEGVVVLESGLQYREITSGDGAQPAETDIVTVHYKGTLIDGTEFDSSYGRGEPATFPVNGVIPGWVEALQLMQVGDKWELFIPSDLAYGPGGTGSTIGPNATLIFEVELLDLTKGQ